MTVVREKQVLKNLLEKYRDLPVLWDQSHEKYGNKLARKEGYNSLLEIYKVTDPDINIHEIKKKLENMRTTYRRERVKVIKARMNGEPEYIPMLWYYNLFTFLDESVEVSTSTQYKRSTPTYMNEEEEEREDREEDEVVDYLKSESLSNSPPPIKKQKPSRIFLRTDVHEESITIGKDQRSQNNVETSSTQSFGKTIGLQLNELKPLQRYIAEKLISDVIFYGRLDKLQSTTTLNVNNNDY